MSNIQYPIFKERAASSYARDTAGHVALDAVTARCFRNMFLKATPGFVKFRDQQLRRVPLFTCSVGYSLLDIGYCY
jgi:hypothetical protein